MVGTHTVIQSTAEPFAERSSAVMECLAYGRISDDGGLDLEAPCVITDGDGDALFLTATRWAGEMEQGGGGDGAAIIAGGDGKYAGIEGVCSYSTDYLSDTQPRHGRVLRLEARLRIERDPIGSRPEGKEAGANPGLFRNRRNHTSSKNSLHFWAIQSPFST